MVVNFASINFDENPVLILKTASDDILGALGSAYGISGDFKLNETSTLEFTVPSEVDGVSVPLYDELVSTRIVELQDIACFTLINPTENNNGATRSKKCTAYSLEYEFTYKKITLPEDTYRFYADNNNDETILGIIMSYMPSWHVGTVSDSLKTRYRTFEISGENLYNIIKNTVQQAYNCIFDFDTLTRTVNVMDVSEETSIAPIFISTGNLAKSIEVSEKTEDIVTRLDVTGADSVDIRDVNPTGTNRIINLDYFMNTTNFSQEVIARYKSWKDLCATYSAEYFSLSVQHVLQQMRYELERAKLTDLKGELQSLENQQAVIIQSVAEGLEGITQADLDAINDDIDDKNAEISAQTSVMNGVGDTVDNIQSQLRDIVSLCRFETYFTSDEYLKLDRYIKDGSVSEESFVATGNQAYISEDKSLVFSGGSFIIEDAVIDTIKAPTKTVIYEIKSGKLKLTNSDVSDAYDCSGEIITAYLSCNTSNPHKTECTFSARMKSLKFFGEEASAGSISITGYTTALVSADDSSLSIDLKNISRYFTSEVSEFEKRSVSWDLYQYGEEVLSKLSQPTFSFSVTVANFLAAADFIAFKNQFGLGQKLYLETIKDDEKSILCPIVIGASFSFGDIRTLNLQFGDSYVASDSTFKLVDLLEQSVSAGKSVEVSKYAYAAFINSGASEDIKTFLQSTLDVAKNAIISSESQAITWDATGIRIRKWTDDTHSGYAGEQIWIANNGFLMTKDGWKTADVAIGKFHDPELGDVYGIAAPLLVGKLIIGNELLIETTKVYYDEETGGVRPQHVAFRVDEDGAHLYNSDLIVTKDVVNPQTERTETIQIAITPDLGFLIGVYPVFTKDDSGNYQLNTENCRFWADDYGNLNMSGIIYASGGQIGGANGWFIDSGSIHNGEAAALGDRGGTYMGYDGISVGGSVIMKPDGSFIIRRDSISAEAESAYVLKVEPTASSIEPDNPNVKDYKLILGEVSFEDEFALSELHGGTGGHHYGIYKVTSGDERDALEAHNGDLCVVYDGPMITLSSSIVSDSNYWFKKNGNGRSYKTLDYGNGGGSDTTMTNRFGLTSNFTWNTAYASDQANAQNLNGGFALVGCSYWYFNNNLRSYGPCAIVMPVQISDMSTTRASGVTVTIQSACFLPNYYYNNADAQIIRQTTPRKFTVCIYEADPTKESQKLIAKDTITLATTIANVDPQGHSIRTLQVQLNGKTGAFKRGSNYFVVIYGTGAGMWMKIRDVSGEPDGITLGPPAVVASSDAGVYYRSGDVWTKL